jgi:hypothetical protein
MPALQTPSAKTVASEPSCAVVWLNGREATLARTTGGGGGSSVSKITRGAGPEPIFLAAVVRAIGDRQHVLIMGPRSTRLDLERECVSLFRRPDRLLDVEPAGIVTADDRLTVEQRAERGSYLGCSAGALSSAEHMRQGRGPGASQT